MAVARKHVNFKVKSVINGSLFSSHVSSFKSSFEKTIRSFDEILEIFLNFERLYNHS